MAKVKTVDSFDPTKPMVQTTRWADGVVTVSDLGDLTPEVYAFCAWHGVKQLRNDTHSGIYAETGSVPACRDASEAKWDSLKSGEITRGRTSQPWIYDAMAEIWKLDVDDAVEAFGNLDAKTQKALFETKEVRTWKAKRDLERASGLESKVDFEKMFAKKPAKGSK